MLNLVNTWLMCVHWCQLLQVQVRPQDMQRNRSDSQSCYHMADMCALVDFQLLQVQVRPQDKQRNRSDVPLVIYVLLESDDPENEANFMYYVREAIREHDGCTHLILVDQRRVSLPHPALYAP